MAQTVVLSVGFDPQLLVTRDLVLRSAGYIVVSVYSLKEAAERFQGGDFDLVLLCQSIPAKEKDRLCSWIRATGSGIPVVAVSGSLYPRDVDAGVTVGSDPRTLLWGIREVLINSENLAAEKRATRKAMSPDRQALTAAQEKMPSRPSTGHEQQAGSAEGRLVALRRAG
jgi:DNA-binding response OmpR family regulator